MVEKLNPKKVALSLASVAGIIYVVCAILVAIAPAWTVNTFGALFHGIDITSLATSPDLGTGILGLVVSVVSAYIFGAIFALIYNKYSK